MKKTNFLFISLVFLAVTACQPKPVEIDTKAISDEITNIEVQWTAANQAMDVDKCMSFYASDATLMNQGEPVAFGIESIQKATETSFADSTTLFNTFKTKVEKIDVAESGDLVIARYSFILQVKLLDKVMDVRGKGLDIFKKVNGDWKCYITIYNTDM